jgi:hypothetical protein
MIARTRSGVLRSFVAGQYARRFFQLHLLLVYLRSAQMLRHLGLHSGGKQSVENAADPPKDSLVNVESKRGELNSCDTRCDTHLAQS